MDEELLGARKMSICSQDQGLCEGLVLKARGHSNNGQGS